MLDALKKFTYLLTPRERRGAVALLCLMCIGALLDVAGVGAIPAFIALLSDPARVMRIDLVRRAFDRIGATYDGGRVLAASVALALLFLAKNAYLAAYTWVQARYTHNRQVGFSTRLFTAYLRAPYTFHLGRNSAELLDNVTAVAMTAVGDGLVPALRIIMETLVLSIVLALLMAVDPVLSVTMLALLGGVSMIFVLSLRRHLARLSYEETLNRWGMLKVVNEGVSAIKEIRVLRRESFFERAFATHAHAHQHASHQRSVLFELPRLFLETVAMLAIVAVTGYFILKGRPVREMVPVLTLLGVSAVRLMPSANRVANSVMQLRWGRVCLEKLYVDLRLLEQPQVQAIGQPVEAFRSAIEYRSVRYRYPSASSDALVGLDLRIEKGMSVGFVGASGAGKSTAVDVLLGVLRPTSGEVVVDGVDIQGDLHGWQSQVGYIPQHITLVDQTVRRNIAFGVSDDDIDDAAVWAAIDAAQLRDVVTRLPDGLDTLLGEHGVRLSGGQRQRVGIARALYHNPAVLVMDEATSALDHGTEREVVAALEQLRGSRTMIIVAHRLSTIVDCDLLLVFEKGEVKAAGTYAELLRSDVVFQALQAPTTTADMAAERDSADVAECPA